MREGDFSTQFTSITKNFIDYVLIIPSLKIQRSRRRLEPNNPRNVLTHIGVLPLKSFRNWLMLIIRIGCLYITLKWFLIAIVHFMRDLALEDWNPNQRDISGGRKFCDMHKQRNYSQIYANTEDIKAQLKVDRLTNWIKFMGDQTTSTIGTSVVFYFLLPSMLVSYVFTSMIAPAINGHELRIDFLAFLCEPENEIARLSQDVKVIVEELIRLFESQHRWLISDHKKNLPLESASNQVKDLNLINAHHDCHFGNKLTIGLDNRAREQNLFDYFRMLKEFGNLDELELYKITVDYHRRLTIGFNVTVTLFTMIGLGSCLLFGVFVICIEFYARFELFKYAMNCSSASEHELINYKRKFVLNHMVYSQQEVNDFSNDDGSILNTVILMIHDFSTYFTIPRRLVGALETTFASLVMVPCIALFGCIHIFAHVDKFIWLNQINTRMRHCIKSMISTDEVTDFSPSEEESERIQRIFKQLTTNLINLKLFMRQQRGFKKLSNFLILQGCGLTMSVMISVYLVGVNLRTDSKVLILLSATYVAGYVNLYLICSAIVVNRIDELKTLTLRLIACSKTNQFKSHIFCLYYTEMSLEKIELKRLYSPSFLGFYISYERVITLAGYLGALWLVLYSHN